MEWTRVKSVRRFDFPHALHSQIAWQHVAICPGTVALTRPINLPNRSRVLFT